jgi:predicted ATP-grasp superfamily ATP-dependent carboligase
MRVIVLGLEHPRGVASIRSLGRAGVPVIGVDHLPNALGFRSRYLTERFRIGGRDQDALGLLETLGPQGGGVLMPTNDHYLRLVARNSERLSSQFVLTTPPWDVLDRLMDTPRCYGMAQSIGLKTPRFFAPGSARDLTAVLAELDLDRHRYILKTMPGTGPADAQTGRFTKVAGATRDAIEAACLEIFSRLGQFPVILEVVPGEADRCIGVNMVVDVNHEPVVWFCVRRLKLFTYSRGGDFIHPYELGANVYCESVHDDEAVEATKMLVKESRYCGPITLEFRRDPRDGRLTVIKADPRFVRATSLSTALGVDLPIAVYRAFTSGRMETPRAYRDGVAWIWGTVYLDTLWRNRAHRPVRRELLTLLRRAHRIRAFAYASLRDPLPGVIELERWARKQARRAARRVLRLFRPLSRTVSG